MFRSRIARLRCQRLSALRRRRRRRRLLRRASTRLKLASFARGDGRICGARATPRSQDARLGVSSRRTPHAAPSHSSRMCRPDVARHLALRQAHRPGATQRHDHQAPRQEEAATGADPLVQVDWQALLLARALVQVVRQGARARLGTVQGLSTAASEAIGLSELGGPGRWGRPTSRGGVGRGLQQVAVIRFCLAVIRFRCRSMVAMAIAMAMALAMLAMTTIMSMAMVMFMMTATLVMVAMATKDDDEAE